VQWQGKHGSVTIKKLFGSDFVSVGAAPRIYDEKN
jgi:hypothetical protein